MALTRKDFVAIVQGLCRSRTAMSHSAFVYLVINVANALESTNPQFNKSKFKTACGIENNT